MIVGASLAGCTAAILLGRAGARVALVEKQPDPQAYKRICSHFIQSSAVPTLERLGLLGPDRGGRRHAPALPRLDEMGLDRAAAATAASLAVNLRRELLDPLRARDGRRRRRASTCCSGRRRRSCCTRRRRRRRRRRRARQRAAPRRRLRARLTIGADGRDSRIAELASVPVKTHAARALRLRRLLRGPAAGRLARRDDLDARPAVRGRLPDRRRPRLLRRDGDEGPAARVQDATRRPRS